MWHCSERRARILWQCLGLLLLWGGSWAGHTLRATCSVPPQWQERRIQLNIGRVIAYPSLPIGSDLAVRAFDVNSTASYATCNSSAPDDFIGVMGMTQQQVPGLDHVYATNLAGVGIRLALVSSTGAINYFPFTESANRNTVYTFRGAKLRLELVKTADSMATGELSPGMYANYYNAGPGAGRRILSANILAGDIDIVAPSCSVDAGSRNVAVEFGSVPAGDFRGVGSTTAERAFTLRFNCNRSVDTVEVRFDATPDPSRAPGVLQLNPTDPVASGVGIQLLDGRNNQPITFGDNSTSLGQATSGVMSLPLKARYYQTGTPIKAGPAQGTATFTLQYN